jgi:hypothetical protein
MSELVVVGSIPRSLWGWLLKSGALCFVEDDDAGEPNPPAQPGPAEAMVSLNCRCTGVWLSAPLCGELMMGVFVPPRRRRGE